MAWGPHHRGGLAAALLAVSIAAAPTGCGSTPDATSSDESSGLGAVATAETIPDVRGVYQSSDTTCLGHGVLAVDDAVTSYELTVSDGDDLSLTMTSATSCTVTDNSTDAAAAEVGCAYADAVFTLTFTGTEACTVTQTKSTATCGNDTCESSLYETPTNCAADCATTVSDISFIPEKTWTTASPTSDCLANLTGATTGLTFTAGTTATDTAEVYLTTLSDGTENGTTHTIIVTRGGPALTECNISIGAGTSQPLCTLTTACTSTTLSATGCTIGETTCAITLQ
jgi:hypothetical protein